MLVFNPNNQYNNKKIYIYFQTKMMMDLSLWWKENLVDKSFLKVILNMIKRVAYSMENKDKPSTDISFYKHIMWNIL